MKVLTAVITYNRLNLLKKCLNKINCQTFKNNDLIVINNSSTDGTENYLKNNNINFITQENLGSAAGWYSCIKYAKNNNYDYIWLMDDDGYPDPKALKILLKTIEKDSDIICISSIVLNEINKNELVFPLPLLNKYQQPKIIGLKRKYYLLNELKRLDNLTYPYAQLFNGSLISLKLFNKMDNINKNFYIFGEEVDFFWRMKNVGKVLTHLNAYHYHPNVQNRIYSEIKIYYFIKNSIINNFKHLSNISLRNILTLVIILYRVYKRNSFLDSLSLILGGKNNLFYKAIFRGLKRQLLIDHDK